MTITPLAFVGGSPSADLVTDADLRVFYPSIINDLWEEHTTYRPQLVAAFDQLLVDLAARGYVAAQISDSDTNRAWAKRAVIHGGLSMIFRAFVTQSGDRWSERRTDHDKKYSEMLESVSLDYDDDNDGTVETDPVTAPLELSR